MTAHPKPPGISAGREGLRQREAERSAAHSKLMAAIATVVDHGGSAPCLSPVRSHWWTSDDADELEAAARLCGGCEALKACKTYADQFEEVAGIWAGLLLHERKMK